MSPEEWTTSSDWLIELLDSYAVEIQQRDLVVHPELDPQFQLCREPRLEQALRGLFRFVFATLPNGCEVYLSSARTIAAVTRLDSGTLTLRWQVVGEVPKRGEGMATPIRPLAGGASLHTRSQKARSLEEDFRKAGWSFVLETTEADTELWVRAATR